MTKSLINDYPYNVINYPSNACKIDISEDSISYNQMGIDSVVQVANYQTVKKVVTELGLTLEPMEQSHNVYQKLLKSREADSKKRLLDSESPLIAEVIRLPKVNPKDKGFYITVIRNIPSLFDVATHHKKAKDSFCMVTFAGLHQPSNRINSDAMKIISKFLKRRAFKLHRIDIAIDTKDKQPINYGRLKEFKADLLPYSKHGVKLERTSLYINNVDHSNIDKVVYYDKYKKQCYKQGKEKIDESLKDWKRLEFTLTFDVTKDKSFTHYIDSTNFINDLDFIDDVAGKAGVKSYKSDYLIYKLNSLIDGMSHNPKKVVNTLIPQKKTILPPCHQRHLKK
jgi:hypothetical protein